MTSDLCSSCVSAHLACSLREECRAAGIPVWSCAHYTPEEVPA